MTSYKHLDLVYLYTLILFGKANLVVGVDIHESAMMDFTSCPPMVNKLPVCNVDGFGCSMQRHLLYDTSYFYLQFGFFKECGFIFLTLNKNITNLDMGELV